MRASATAASAIVRTRTNGSSLKIEKITMDTLIRSTSRSSTPRKGGQSLRLVYAPSLDVPQYMMPTANEADAKGASARMQFKDVVKANQPPLMLVREEGLRPDLGCAAIPDPQSERGRREEGLLDSHAVQGRREVQPQLMIVPVYMTQTGMRWHNPTNGYCLRNARGVVPIARCEAERLCSTRCDVCG